MTTLQANLESGTTFLAIDGLNSQITDDSTGLNALQSKITELRGDLDSDIGAATSARSALEQTIKKDSDILLIVNSAIDSFETTLLFDSAGTAEGLVNTARSELLQKIIDSDGIFTIANSAIDSFETQLIGADGAVGQIATAQAGLSQRITANSDSLQTISQKYFVALDDGNTFTGFEVINGDSVSSFTVQADDFKIVNGTNSSVNPFSVNTTTNKVEMSNAQVTGNLDIGTEGAAGMRITDTTITIHDGTRARVILGELP